jgi:beta-galactosidase
MKAFSGKLVVLVQSTNEEGKIELEVEGKDLKKAKATIISKL